MQKRYRQSPDTLESPIQARAGQEGGGGRRERFVVGEEDSRSSPALARLYTVGESAEQPRSPRLVGQSITLLIKNILLPLDIVTTH